MTVNETINGHTDKWSGPHSRLVYSFLNNSSCSFYNNWSVIFVSLLFSVSFFVSYIYGVYISHVLFTFCHVASRVSSDEDFVTVAFVVASSVDVASVFYVDVSVVVAAFN